MMTIQRLDELRVAAVVVEAGASGALLAELDVADRGAPHFSLAKLPSPLEEARARTDAALAMVRTDPSTSRQIAVTLTVLAAARRQVDAATGAPPAQARAARWNAVQKYLAVERLLAAAQTSATNAIVTGKYGRLGRGLSGAAARLQTVSRLVLLGSLRPATLYAVNAAPSAAVPKLRVGLNDVDAAYRLSLAELPRMLSPDLAASWQQFSLGPGAAFDQIMLSSATQSLPDPPDSPSGRLSLTAAASTIPAYVAGLNSLLAQTVAEGTTAASSDRVRAIDRARTAVILTFTLLVLTLAVLLVISRTLHRRLSDVAAAAQRLSAGRLVPMRVRGPREIALASMGLNDAVMNLRQIVVTTERLAAGDINSPEVNHQTPGPLGSAVHASVTLLINAILERQQLQTQLGHQANHDALTGLLNRSEFERRLSAALQAKLDRPTPRVGILFIDLDHFKPINDTYGHRAGDHVLQVSSTRMQTQLRDQDIVARFGGDEFVVMLELADSQVAADIGRRIIEALKQPITFNDEKMQIGASVGIALSAPDESTTEDILIRADLALYRAKTAGRDRLSY